MKKRILIILGHPAREHSSFCGALAASYEKAALANGHKVQFISVGQLRFDPILHEGYRGDQPPELDILDVQEKICWAEHLVIIYPMWEYMIPALLKGFFERCFTKGFAYEVKSKNPFKTGLLHGKSVRVIHTTGMPAIIYRFYYGAHGAKALRDMLKFCGINPVRITYFGSIESSDSSRKRYLKKVEALGHAGI